MDTLILNLLILNLLCTLFFAFSAHYSPNAAPLEIYPRSRGRLRSIKIFVLVSFFVHFIN